MRTSAKLVLAALSLGTFSLAAAPAQISINIGPAPACPYGYYGYAPYNCAPYGYYGPEWFTGGAFLGAGPWWHGREGWHGHVDNGFDPRYGYRGPFPARGDRAFNHFHGGDWRDGHDREWHGDDHGHDRH